MGSIISAKYTVLILSTAGVCTRAQANFNTVYSSYEDSTAGSNGSGAQMHVIVSTLRTGKLRIFQ